MPKNQFGFVPIFLLLSVIVVAGGIMYATYNTQVLSFFFRKPNPEYTPLLVIKNNKIATESSNIQLIPLLKETTVSSSLKSSPSASSSGQPGTSPNPSPGAESGPPADIVHTSRGDFLIQVVTLPINSTMVTDTANDSDCPKDCPTHPLAEFVTSNGGVAGITGTFNCPSDYEECKDKKDSFDFSVYNSRLKKWINEYSLSWDKRSMIYQDSSGMHYEQDAKNFHGSVNAAIVNFPGILNGGQVTVESNGLPDKQKNKGTKTGVGYGKDNIYLLVAYDADMMDFAEIFKSLGATHALNMDGGGGTALYHNGGYKAGPGRNLPNAIIFK